MTNGATSISVSKQPVAGPPPGTALPHTQAGLRLKVTPRVCKLPF